jgi:hypothetical protein
MRSPIGNRVTLHSGGATSPTFELYQRRSGRCRLWTYYFDQDGQKSETIAAFREPDWAKAQVKAKDLLKAALGTGPANRRSPITGTQHRGTSTRKAPSGQ